MRTPQGITPPAPGLEHEEPDLWREEDIPKDDSHGQARSEGGDREERSQRSRERE